MIQPISEDWISQQMIMERIIKHQPTDFYWEDGRMVMTSEYHKRRGFCCGGGCRHCPFLPKHMKGTTTIENPE
jgi:hypothetical protein